MNSRVTIKSLLILAPACFSPPLHLIFQNFAKIDIFQNAPVNFIKAAVLYPSIQWDKQPSLKQIPALPQPRQ